jgi:predicted ATPase
MGQAFRAREAAIRELISQILKAKDRKEQLVDLREQLFKAVGELENATRSHNTSLIEAMAKKLQALVGDSKPPAP